MANDAHLRLAADFLGLLAEISSEGYWSAATDNPARTYMTQSGSQLFLKVIDGEGNATLFEMYDDGEGCFTVGGGY